MAAGIADPVMVRTCQWRAWGSIIWAMIFAGGIFRQMIVSRPLHLPVFPCPRPGPACGRRYCSARRSRDAAYATTGIVFAKPRALRSARAAVPCSSSGGEPYARMQSIWDTAQLQRNGPILALAQAAAYFPRLGVDYVAVRQHAHRQYPARLSTKFMRGSPARNLRTLSVKISTARRRLSMVAAP